MENYILTIKRLALLFVSIGFIFQANISSAENVICAVSDWPPWTVVEGDKVTGIEPEILDAVTKRLNIKVVYKVYPWKRCLLYMENGTVDILSSLVKKPEREAYMRYIDVPYISYSPRFFYVKKGQAHMISAYDDLYKYKIGVTRGSKYFSPFDTDDKIDKTVTDKELQLMKMLLLGRIDSFVGVGTQIDYEILTEATDMIGKFEKAKYRFDKEVKIHFAISKKSKFQTS